jgi:hypothetical protein
MYPTMRAQQVLNIFLALFTIVKTIQVLKEQNAQAGHDVIENGHQHDDPPDAGEALDERLDDASKSRQRFH